MSVGVVYENNIWSINSKCMRKTQAVRKKAYLIRKVQKPNANGNKRYAYNKECR